MTCANWFIDDGSKTPDVEAKCIYKDLCEKTYTKDDKIYQIACGGGVIGQTCETNDDCDKYRGYKCADIWQDYNFLENPVCIHEKDCG